jgi:type VI secretion system protein VasG
MTEISRVALFGKLNPTAYRAIEGATVFCKLRGNAYVELVHWLHQILQAQDSDLHRVVRHFEIDTSRQWERISADGLSDAFDAILGGSPEASLATLPPLSTGCRAVRRRSPISRHRSKSLSSAPGCLRR